jgi:tetratricopeptide (TPR) repeat protein
MEENMMNYRRDSFWYDDEVLSSVSRYEEMMQKHTHYFFDVHEFEDIIDYYLDSENISEASTAANYAARIYPLASSIQLRMAEILIDKSQPVKALSLLNKIEHLETGEYGVYLLRGAALNMIGKPKEAQRQFEKAISMADENKAEVLYNIGMSFERINQHNIALKYFMKVHAMEPENYFVFYDLAYCYERLDELDKSIVYYHKYLDEDPFSEYVWYNLGIVYNKKDENEKALEAYDYAIAINPEYSSAYFNKANTFSSLECFPEAIETYQEFLTIEPDNAAAFCYMGECYEQLEEYDMAKIFYVKSLSLDDKFADAWFGLGVMKSQDGFHEEAVSNILRALALDEDNTEYLFALASAYANLKQYKKSVAIFKKLVKIITGDIYMWDCFAQVYAKQDAFIEARKIILEALHFNPNAALLHYRLAAYYLLDDEQLRGMTVLEDTLKAYPEECNCFFDVFEPGDHDDEIISLINQYNKQS